MTTDDRDDIESNSPASFKVGEVDRLSGFFTPVWESKRRLRAESPIPPASAAAAPSSAGTESEPASESEVPARQPSQPPPSRRAAAAAFVAATPPRASRPPIKGRPSASPAANRREPDAAGAQGGSAKAVGSALRADTKPAAGASSLPKAAAAVASEPSPTPRARPEERPSLEAPADAGGEAAELEPSLDGLTPSVTARPVIPMPQNPGRVTPRAKSSSAPPPAGDQHVGRRAYPGADAALEPASPREPELLAAPPTSAPPARASWPAADQRAVRAAGAAAVLHDKLRGKGVDSAETFGRHRETESEREALQRAAVRAAATPPDPYPLHLLRTLRRTLHLSMPLPESVRAMIDKYRY